MESLPSQVGFSYPHSDELRSLVRLLNKDDAISELIRSCNRIGEAFLFGGVVRDIIFGSSGSFGDLDIFVSGPLDAEFAASISRSSRRTNFGGMRLVVGKYDVDIWELPQSYAFRIEKGRSISIESLLRTVCFSTDSVAVSLVDARVISSSSFRQSVRSRVLSFVSRPLRVDLLQAVRIARLVVKNDVIPDRVVARYYVDSLAAFGCTEFVHAESKWRGRRVLDSYLVDRVEDLCVSVITAPEGAEVSFRDSEMHLHPDHLRLNFA